MASFSLAVAAAAALLLCSAPSARAYTNVFGNCMAKTDMVYKLPDTRLTKLNTFLFGDSTMSKLTKAGCPADRDAGAVCPDKPAIGSGFTQIFPNYFLGLTDRGPNQDCEDLYATDPVKYAEAKDKVGKGFPVPKFAPTIVHFSVPKDSSDIITRLSVPLADRDGKPITGLPNTADDDMAYGPDCAGEPLATDPSGLDTEDIARIRNTEYVAIVDEYSPSVVIASYRTGVITSRHVPKSLGPQLSGANYDIVADIPDVYKNRRKNRGFEAVVVDPFGRYVIAILQSPMIGEDSEMTENNAIIRCAYFTMSVKDGVPSLKYSHTFVIEASSPSAYEDPVNMPKDMKYSAAQFRSAFEFIVLERAKGQVKLFNVNFKFATKIDGTKYADNLGLEKDTNGKYLASQVGITAASKTLVWDSTNGVGGTVDFSGSSKMEGFAIDMVDDSKLWMMNDNDFGLYNNGAVQLHKFSLGRSSSGATICEMPAHPPAPKIKMIPSRKLVLKNPSTYRISNEVGAGSAENFDVAEELKRAFVVNDDTHSVDMYDVSKKVADPMKSYKLSKSFTPTSVSVCESRSLIAVGLANDDDDTAPGRIDVLDTDLNMIRQISRKECVLVDDVKWTEDCKFIVGACEGEGKDVPGGIMIADFGGPPKEGYRATRFASFKLFDKLTRFFAPNGVRLIESQVPSNDLEPEYVVTDGKHAFVTLQENNAIAVVDLHEAAVTELKPIGFIDRSKRGFSLDASDKDGKIYIRPYKFLYGMPQPDTIKKYVAKDGKTYLIFANEGDAKDSEEVRGEDICDPEELGRNAPKRLKYLTSKKALLGRLKVTSVMGYNESTNMQEKLFHYGSRSFSIMSMDGKIVFDSGNWFALIQRRYFKKIFNANNYDDEDLSLSMEDLVDNRSDDKGMEPESLDVMTTEDGKTYSFIGFERSSTIVVFDVTDPMGPIFVSAVNNNPTSMPIEKMFEEGKQGDMDPEGLFASLKMKKLLVSGSVSNTVTMYDMVMS